MRIIPIRALATAVACGLVLAACGGSAGSSGKVDVVASFFPLAEVARNVGGDHVDVRTLTPPGVEPHDLELTTDQVQAAHDADVLVYLGHGFQPAVSDLVGQVDGHRVDGLAGLSVVDDDPHVWLDPTLMQRITSRVEAALAQADPDHRADYAANARRYRDQLGQLHRRFDAGLADCARNILVTSHAAYLYMASRYGLEQEAVTGTSPESEPSPARLADLTHLVADAGVTTIFTEPLVTGGPAATLARETGTKTATLDPVEGPPKDAPSSTYVQLMGRNLAKLRAALGCR